MTSSQGLAGRIIPARGAAEKATASFAEQLIDSPGRSDGDSPSSFSLFREPAHGTKSVKYRYSGIGKHLSSPLMGSSSSPERKPAKSKLKSVATPSSHVPKANVPATVAPTPRKRKASASPLRRMDVPNPNVLFSPSPLSSAPSTPVLSTKDLPPSPSLSAKELARKPQKRLSVSKTFSLRSLGHTTPKFSVSSQPLSQKRKQKKTKANAKEDADVWDIGNSVWVLVNQSGLLADNITNPDGSGLLMWWPAQVVQKQPLRVSLFGEFPSSSSSSRGLCTIFTPSSSNVLSVNDDSGSKRFSRTTFRLTSLSANDNVADVSPATKKPRLDEAASVEAKWESAVQSMEKTSTLEKDGLPALLSSYAATGDSFYDSLDDTDPDASDLQLPLSLAQKKSKPTGSTRKLKPQRSKANLKEDASLTRAYSPCPPDPTLQIPGELVLALAPRAGGSYWPAKILAHVPDPKEKYRVRYLDDKEHVITRDRFWTSEEEGFIRCTLGKWESAVKTVDDLESGDEGYGAEDDANVRISDDVTAVLPSPPPAEDFEDLSVRAQLAYVKPVLRAILNKEYVPAKEKHEAFMKGGSARVALLKSAGVRGGMDARFVKAVQKAICEWVLGDNRPRRELDSGDQVSGTGGIEESTATKVVPSKVVPAETLRRDPTTTTDDKMEGIEGMVSPEGVQIGKVDDLQNGVLPLPAFDRHAGDAQTSEMVVDRQEQQPAPSPPANGVTLSPVVQQASLAAKSQLDLLAEVSQAVATEPSLLPSHPEVPKLKVDLPPKDMASQPSPLTPIPDEDQRILTRRSEPVVCDEFDALSNIEKLDYCLNILLPESIQQLLLWRSGERASATLLSPEEEQRLHDIGARKATETDWVDDLMRLRTAQARLWGVDLGKRTEEKNSVAQGGTRSRPRRETVSRC